MSEEERNCRRCGVPIAPDGLCDFCAMDNLKASNRLEDKGTRMPVQVRDILTGPPSADELASAATVCERARVHLSQKPLYDKNGAKDILLAKNIDALKTATWVLKHLLGSSFVVLFILLGCTNDTSDETEPDRFVEPDSTSTYTYGHYSEDEPQPVTTEGTDAAIDEPEEPDAAIDPSCAYSGTWSVRFVQGTLCISQNDPLVLVIDDCDRTDFERSLEMSDPTFGDFAGSITYHVDFEGQDSLTGTADIVGTVTRSGQELQCSTVATISGVKDETRESS